MLSRLLNTDSPLLVKLSTSVLVSVVSLLTFPSITPAQPTAQPVPPTVDAAAQREIIDSVAVSLAEVYVFPETARKMSDLLYKNLKNGMYKDLTDLREFTIRLTEDMRSISHDRHLGIRIIPPDYVEEEDENYEQEMLTRYRRENFAFKKLEHLPGNIGYVKFNAFVDAAWGGPTAIAAMNFLGNCDAIIFDLSDNGGGSPSMIQLISSYLFKDKTHLNSFYLRETDSIQQFWTQDYVPGPRMADIPVYVLTSDYTFSGAEEFSYNLQNLKRGLIVGDTTGGGAHPVSTRLFKNLGVGIRVPFGRAINPISGTNWEGTGVIPDIAIAPEQALDYARVMALDTLINMQSDENRKFALQWVRDGLQASLNPVNLDDKQLQEYVGDYGPRHIRLMNGRLIYQRDERQPFEIVPMDKDMFMLPDLDYFRLRFERDGSGRIIKIVGSYDNGEVDSNPRD